MSEPTSRADRIERLIQGLYHSTVHDDRINYRSDAYAVRTPEGCILIDPLPLTDQAITSIRGVLAILLTGAFHQRSAWRYRKHFDAPVIAPKDSQGLEEEPDQWYGPGDMLPGDIQAIHTPGPAEAHYALLWYAPEGQRVLFIADLLARDKSGALRFVPDEYQDDPSRTRESVRQLIGLKPDIICPAHGEPLLSSDPGYLQEVLDHDAEQKTS